MIKKCYLHIYLLKFTLSQVGKIVSIKSNFSGIPIYNMSGIKIPNYIDKELDNAYSKYFWTNNLNYDQNLSRTL